MNRSISKLVKSVVVASLTMAGVQSAYANPFTVEAQCSAQALPISSGNCTIGITVTDANANNPSQVNQVAIRINGTLVSLRRNDRSNPSSGADSSATGALLQVACGSSYSVAAFVQISGQSGFVTAGASPLVICP